MCRNVLKNTCALHTGRIMWRRVVLYLCTFQQNKVVQAQSALLRLNEQELFKHPHLVRTFVTLQHFSSSRLMFTAEKIFTEPNESKTKVLTSCWRLWQNKVVWILVLLSICSSVPGNHVTQLRRCGAEEETAAPTLIWTRPCGLSVCCDKCRFHPAALWGSQCFRKPTKAN